MALEIKRLQLRQTRYEESYNRDIRGLKVSYHRSLMDMKSQLENLYNEEECTTIVNDSRVIENQSLFE